MDTYFTITVSSLFNQNSSWHNSFLPELFSVIFFVNFFGPAKIYKFPNSVIDGGVLHFLSFPDSESFFLFSSFSILEAFVNALLDAGGPHLLKLADVVDVICALLLLPLPLFPCVFVIFSC